MPGPVQWDQRLVDAWRRCFPIRNRIEHRAENDDRQIERKHGRLPPAVTSLARRTRFLKLTLARPGTFSALTELPTRPSRRQTQERIASIAWAMRTTALAAMRNTNNQLTSASDAGSERVHPCTVKNHRSGTAIPRLADASQQQVHLLSALSAECQKEQHADDAGC